MNKKSKKLAKVVLGTTLISAAMVGCASSNKMASSCSGKGGCPSMSKKGSCGSKHKKK